MHRHLGCHDQQGHSGFFIIQTPVFCCQRTLTNFCGSWIVCQEAGVKESRIHLLLTNILPDCPQARQSAQGRWWRSKSSCSLTRALRHSSPAGQTGSLITIYTCEPPSATLLLCIPLAHCVHGFHPKALSQERRLSSLSFSSLKKDSFCSLLEGSTTVKINRR